LTENISVIDYFGQDCAQTDSVSSALVTPCEWGQCQLLRCPPQN